jgi:hypothetical protein
LPDERKHRHHIIPKHMGGSDDESNLTGFISTQEHASLHEQLWVAHGFKQDYIAWKALSGRITGEQARLLAAKIGQDNSEKYKKSRVGLGKRLAASATPESLSRGGKTASAVLVRWQKENSEKFAAQCRQNGRVGAVLHMIPHEYLGVTYISKKELQVAHKMKNWSFYTKLTSGEIKRLPVKRRTSEK